MNPTDIPPELRALRRLIATRGGVSVPEVAEATGVSPSTARLRLDALGDQIVRWGRARATRYGLRAPLDGLSDPLPLYEIGRAGERPAHVADVVPLADDRVLVLGRVPTVPTEVHPDLPWFLGELRPQGYLGRQIPARHPDLPVPRDILLWSTRHVLSWAARHAWDPVGAFVLGSHALEAWGAAVRDPSAPVPVDDRGAVWEAMADEAVARGPVGSSAGGEQPKLLSVRAGGPHGGVPVLVKWSPPVDGPAGVRVADLLRAEGHALGALRDGGIPAAAAAIATGARRVFLEVERFDRDGPNGRLGQVALAAADGAFVGSDGTWRSSAAGLHRAGKLGEGDLRRILLLDRVAALIGHGDRHLYNLSVRLEGARIVGLAPAYDFAPMRWGLVNGEVVDRPPEAPPPRAEDAPIEGLALAIARDHWARVHGDPAISPGFRAIAEAGLRAMDAVEAAGRWLPAQ